MHHILLLLGIALTAVCFWIINYPSIKHLEREHHCHIERFDHPDINPPCYKATSSIWSTCTGLGRTPRSAIKRMKRAIFIHKRSITIQHTARMQRALLFEAAAIAAKRNIGEQHGERQSKSVGGPDKPSSN